MSSPAPSPSPVESARLEVSAPTAEEQGELLFPIFLKLAGRKVVVVGGGTVAAAKIAGLRGMGAEVVVIAPELRPEIRDEAARAPRGLTLVERPFRGADLDGAWLAIAAATPEVNRQVAAAAEAEGRRLFVVAVDDPPAASAYGCGTLRRGGVTFAISTQGQAPALAGLLREALEAVLPEDLGAWLATARALRAGWRAGGLPMARRRPLLLEALNRLYAGAAGGQP
jgi:uroporphyrin-III C-methyltransferase/precorrin-2 dehydrogenase/sirohydrochlorin ferrochelatase